MKKIVWSFFLISLAAVLLIAQDYEVTVTSISVWVKVTDSSGKSIEGLTANDFEIQEDGKKVTATCFEESALGAEGEPRPNQRTTTKVVIYLDLLNTLEHELDDLRPGLEQFLNQVSDKHWEVMLAVQEPGGQFGVAVPFTKDVEEIRANLLQASGDRDRDMNAAHQISQLSDTLDSILQADPRARQALMQTAYKMAEEFAEEEKVATEYSIAGLNEFTNEISKLQMTDHVVVVLASGGINVQPGRVYYDMLDAAVQKMDMERDSGEALLNEMSRSLSGTREDIKKSIGKLNRNNVTVYSLNTRGLFTPDSSRRHTSFKVDESELWRDYQDFLVQMADETGGLFFQNSQNFKVGIDKILADLNHQYLICYSPPQHKANSFHKIKVECKKKGAKLRYRTGYFD
jgi:VWFA-related protein